MKRRTTYEDQKRKGAPNSARKTVPKAKLKFRPGAKANAKPGAKANAKPGAKANVKPRAKVKGKTKLDAAAETRAPRRRAIQEAFVRHTERLIIRALAPWDFEVWRDAFRAFDPPKNEWDHGGFDEAELKQTEFHKMLQQQTHDRAHDRVYHFGVFLRTGGRMIGATALMDISRGVFQNAYLGYWLGNIHWGRGYAREAVQATIDIGFEDLQLHRIEAGIAPKNKRSLILARALGMRREGLSRRRVFGNGHWQDLVLYALTSEDRGFTFEPR